jgi:Cu-processing system permease protein
MIAYLIARNTFREASRDRLLLGALGAGAVLLVATQLLGPLALGEGIRLTVDLGLSGISIIGLMLVLLVGTSLVSKEIDRRTIFNLLSRPLARHTYLIGKWAGLSATLWVVAFAMGAALSLLLAVRGHAEFVPGIAQATYLAALELAVVTACAVLFSAISTPVLSALFTTGLYLVGQWSYDLRDFAAKFPPAAAGVCNLAANLVPNLPLFNMRTLAANAETATFAQLAVATVYAVVYCGAALGLATAAFETRDFK